jgi:two-component sensor histidine kinase
MRIAGLVGWEIDAATGLILHDDGLPAMFGVDPAAHDGTMAAFAARIHPEDLAGVLEAFEGAKRPGGVYRAEFRVLGGPLEACRVLIGMGEGVPREDGGLSVIGYNADVTEEREREAALRQALEQNEWLRLEADHRIKNHLAIVSSLLEAQARSSVTAEVQGALRAAGARLHTIAGIHRILAETGVQSQVRLDSFLDEIVRETLSAMDVTGEVGLRLEIEPIVCGPAFATNVAHVVTELVTNAVKHAPTSRPLNVRVTGVARDGVLTLKVGDDGDGLPADFNIRAGGVGFKVMTALARGLNGSIAPADDGPGASFALTCPLPSPT